MVDAGGKAILVLGASTVATVEAFAYTLWLFDRDPSCRANTSDHVWPLF